MWNLLAAVTSDGITCVCKRGTDSSVVTYRVRHGLLSRSGSPAPSIEGMLRAQARGGLVLDREVRLDVRPGPTGLPSLMR